jgi:apolipoprotein N-acyltransferase
MEWLRGWNFTGFTWLQLGYSQVDSPLAGLAPVLGVYALSWMVALSAGLFLMALRHQRQSRWGALAGLLLIWGGAALLRPGGWTQPAGAPLRVALLQGNISQDVKWQAGHRQATLETYLEMTRSRWGADLLVWPESALPGFYHTFATFVTLLAEEARQHHTALLLGTPYRDETTARYYNSIAVLDAEPPRFYHKRHLVPFGEYLPLPDILSGAVDFFRFPMSDFSRGPDFQPPLAAAGQKLGLSICYEIAFSPVIRTSLPAATLLVNVSNDAWFGNTIGPHQHLQMARMRALETGRYLLRATNTGISAIIDPQGKIKGRSPQFVPHVLAGEVIGYTGATPYLYSGDRVVLSGLLLALGGAIIAGWKKSPTHVA